jgi:hypothetical protein
MGAHGSTGHGPSRLSLDDLACDFYADWATTYDHDPLRGGAIEIAGEAA